MSLSPALLILSLSWGPELSTVLMAREGGEGLGQAVSP